MERVTFGTYSMAPPEGWTLSSVILSGPVDEAPPVGPTTRGVRPFQRNMITTLELVDDKTTPENYVDRQIEGLRQAGVARQEAKKPEAVNLADGLRGLLTEQIIQGAGGERVRQMQLVFIKRISLDDDQAVSVAHTAIASHLDGLPFESAREEFRAMLLSFA